MTRCAICKKSPCAHSTVLSGDARRRAENRAITRSASHSAYRRQASRGKAMSKSGSGCLITTALLGVMAKLLVKLLRH